jgi:hypothetical protein
MHKCIPAGLALHRCPEARISHTRAEYIEFQPGYQSMEPNTDQASELPKVLSIRIALETSYAFRAEAYGKSSCPNPSKFTVYTEKNESSGSLTMF